MSDFIGDTVTQRLEGDDPSRLRALGAAVMIGFATGVLAYRLLRSGS
jgi:hypothetical protein